MSSLRSSLGGIVADHKRRLSEKGKSYFGSRQIPNNAEQSAGRIIVLDSNGNEESWLMNDTRFRMNDIRLTMNGFV